MGKRLHKILGQVGSELWFPWQQIAPIGLQWEKCCEHSSAYIFDRIFFILEGNEDSHKISDEFEIAIERWKKSPLTYNGKDVVNTLALSFLIRSSSFLQVTRTTIRSRMSSKFSKIRPWTAELPALKRLENGC